MPTQFCTILRTVGSILVILAAEYVIDQYFSQEPDHNP